MFLWREESRNRTCDDAQWWWSSSDDPDPMMIRIQWWCPVIIQIEWWSRSIDDVQWWSRSSDDIDPKMNMTWRRDDPDDTEKNTCADKLCRVNTFLVKRECWCNCNFAMYSLVFLMYCNPMSIPGCVCNVIESCHAPMFRSRYKQVMSSQCG